MFVTQPNSVYSTGPHGDLRDALRSVWGKELKTKNHWFVVSGFCYLNGVLQIRDLISQHVREYDGTCTVILGGSPNMKMSSKEAVMDLLDAGARVFVINRKQIMHSKLYGSQNDTGAQSLIVTSGNLTYPGLVGNIESALVLDADLVSGIEFDWFNLVDSMLKQKWQIHEMTEDRHNPGWNCLFDEVKSGTGEVDLYENKSMVITLSHNDIIRIKEPETVGTQYFFLSKDDMDFFPPLTEKNTRGWKATYKTYINISYPQLEQFIENEAHYEASVTFEAGNNLDFRLGTGVLKWKKMPWYGKIGIGAGDLAIISNNQDETYSIVIIPKEAKEFHKAASMYATKILSKISDKTVGFIPEEIFKTLVDKFGIPALIKSSSE